MMDKGKTREQRVEITRASGQSKRLRPAKKVGDGHAVSGGRGEAGRLRRHQARPADSLSAGRAQADGLEELGRRLHPLLGCLDLFFEEACVVLDEIGEGALSEDLSEKLRVVREILDWSGAVAQDLHVEANRAMAGVCSVNSLELFREAAAQVQSEGLDVTVASSGVVASCQGRRADLCEAFCLALSIVAQRIGGSGSLKVEIVPEGGWIAHRITGQGPAGEVDCSDRMARLRALLVDGHGARMVPDLLTPGRVGMTILLLQRD